MWKSVCTRVKLASSSASTNKLVMTAKLLFLNFRLFKILLWFATAALLGGFEIARALWFWGKLNAAGTLGVEKPASLRILIVKIATLPIRVREIILVGALVILKLKLLKVFSGEYLASQETIVLMEGHFLNNLFILKPQIFSAVVAGFSNAQGANGLKLSTGPYKGDEKQPHRGDLTN